MAARPWQLFRFSCPLCFYASPYLALSSCCIYLDFPALVFFPLSRALHCGGQPPPIPYCCCCCYNFSARFCFIFIPSGAHLVHWFSFGDLLTLCCPYLFDRNDFRWWLRNISSRALACLASRRFHCFPFFFVIVRLNGMT